MSEQTTHTINDTVDPQFLGPEAGQQAGGEGEPIYGMTATYSPDDNKLRLTSVCGRRTSMRARQPPSPPS